ncbi:MAG: hypothetical protein H7Z14_03020 [Anaerolineae bacterium]|nr:hypothetical protein [Phycisphaerae bacterium]
MPITRPFIPRARSARPAPLANFNPLTKNRLAFARTNSWFILSFMQSQNGRESARSLRDHLAQTIAVKQQELERKLSKSAANSRDELFAQVSQEAADLDYERWDGMS